MMPAIEHLRPPRYFADVTGQRPSTVERQIASGLVRPTIVHRRPYLRVNEAFRFLEWVFWHLELLPSNGPYGRRARALGKRAARTLRRRIRFAVERSDVTELEVILRSLRELGGRHQRRGARGGGRSPHTHHGGRGF
jgi:hypothetical protein